MAPRGAPPGGDDPGLVTGPGGGTTVRRADRRGPGRGSGPRLVALEGLRRIDDGAYANLVLPGLLERSDLSGRDRALVTELVYGVTRMRRALDCAIDPHLRGALDAEVRDVLRMGAYQLLFMEVPAHAAVSTAVDCAPRRARGLVNAVLRRVSQTPASWTDVGAELSYPDWIVERLIADLGTEPARAALEWMNRPATVTVREDGVVQDRASQWVVDFVGAAPGLIVADVCAGPGGKTTGLAGAGALRVTATDVNGRRAQLVRENADRLGLETVDVLVGDASAPPMRDATFDRVLVDAPCSGLGVLRRRADARWRVEADAPARLAGLQRRLLAGAAPLVRPGGWLVFSVCTLTRAETVDIDRWAEGQLAGFEAVPPPGPPWRPHGRGALLLPQDADTDGMFVLGLVRSAR
ncbi:MAG TPA: transcription antitermination factor NusB [Acidimicrobiales bacterium]|nr:transcription antitermination factor NusB [Acidimicrobiales bacterium]